MATLKQLFKEAGSIYRDDTDEPTYIYQYKALEKVKEWLLQKRQKVMNLQAECGFEPPQIPMINIDDLLEELK